VEYTLKQNNIKGNFVLVTPNRMIIRDGMVAIISSTIIKYSVNPEE